MVKPVRPRAKKEPTPPKAKAALVPDLSVLARYAPTDGANAHPDWIKTRFPDYVSPHRGHATAGVREFTTQGHVVRITTTYRVEVDGKEIAAHLSVDEDGRVYTHATPFVTYASAVDLMSAVIESYPEAFAAGSGAPSTDRPASGAARHPSSHRRRKDPDRG